MKGFLSVDVDVSSLEVNQCDVGKEPVISTEITALRGTHKCHNDTSQVKNIILFLILKISAYEKRYFKLTKFPKKNQKKKNEET